MPTPKEDAEKLKLIANGLPLGYVLHSALDVLMANPPRLETAEYREEKPKMRLCYIEDCWAFFTDRELDGPDRQWGDDWNDAPYEHNAGRPYSHDGQRIEVVGFMADLESPCANAINSPYSVEQINAGVVAWLRSPSYTDELVVIPAGASIEEFAEKVQQAGGKIFRNADPDKPLNLVNKADTED